MGILRRGSAFSRRALSSNVAGGRGRRDRARVGGAPRPTRGWRGVCIRSGPKQFTHPIPDGDGYVETGNSRRPTGLPGLDEVLHGGLIPERAYLVRGGPGTGKTTLGLHFLLSGVASGEKALLITLESAEPQLREDAAAQGLDLTGIEFLDLSPTRDFFAQNQSYDIFSLADVERDPTTRRILETIERLRPQRVFVDAVTTLRYLASDAFQFRKQALSFVRYLVEHGATVLMSSEPTDSVPDDDLRFMCDGIIDLDVSPTHGVLRRTLSISKLRGSDFEGGFHSMRLTNRGMEVYPRLVPGAHERAFSPELIPSGIPELDEMLGGGIERGTITILSGPSGVGKTTVGIQFMAEAARRGQRSVVYAFEEQIDTLMHRCDGIGLPVREMMTSGTLSVVEVEPLRFSPGEFALMVRREVEEHDARIVMIDGIAGYELTLAGDDLVTHLHALGRYLKNMGATVLLMNEVAGITGDFKATEVGISYLCDNLVFLRYLEINGELRKSIGVLKKRLGDFAKTIRQIEITCDGVIVGEPLSGLRGLLTGTPRPLRGDMGGGAA
ncbi:MAG: AAA family ATPase [Gemmatimonadetes bacterium]|nr:AAA family ATPase [Gemmatimonadota bacterium]